MATGRIGVTPVLGTRWSKEPTGGTTSLSGLDDNSVSLVYSVGYEQVYRNGVLLSRGNDYTATDGTSITLTDATITGDIIEVFAQELVPLTDAISKGQFTAKGSLLSASAASTPAVLAVGTNGQVLKADSSTTTGLAWGADGSAAFVGVGLRAAAVSCSNNTLTQITYGTEDFDTDSFHSTVTNTSRITIPSGKAGKYLVNATVRWDTASTSGRRSLLLYLNGSAISQGYQGSGYGGYDQVDCSMNVVVTAAENDYFEIYAFQGSGGTISTMGIANGGHFQMIYLGA